MSACGCVGRIPAFQVPICAQHPPPPPRPTPTNAPSFAGDTSSIGTLFIGAAFDLVRRTSVAGESRGAHGPCRWKHRSVGWVVAAARVRWSSAGERPARERRHTTCGSIDEGETRRRVIQVVCACARPSVCLCGRRRMGVWVVSPSGSGAVAIGRAEFTAQCGQPQLSSARSKSSPSQGWSVRSAPRARATRSGHGSEQRAAMDSMQPGTDDTRTAESGRSTESL